MVVAGIAIAGLAVGGADAVAKLRDLEGGPVEFRQRRYQARNHAGLAHAARVPANHHDCHKPIFAGFGRFKNPQTAVRSPRKPLLAWMSYNEVRELQERALARPLSD